MEKEILINSVFNGDYLTSNDKHVGGEVINFYKDDNFKNYIYVNPYGNIGNEHNDIIEHILFVRSVGNNIAKVIAKASGLTQIAKNITFPKKDKKEQGEDFKHTIDPKQKDYIKDNEISYGGVSLIELGSWSNSFVTFKADSVCLAKTDIYLTPKKSPSEQEGVVFVELSNVAKITNTSQKKYINQAKDKNNYTALEKIIENKKLWFTAEESTRKIDVNDYDKELKPSSFMSIIRKEDDEIINSNLLAYMMENNNDFWSKFATEILDLTEDVAKERPKITRETFYNIDLLIETTNDVIVIENKIKSGINGLHAKRKGYSQLEKYYDAIENKSKDKFARKNKHYFILRPDYNNENYKSFEKGQNYEEIKYSKIGKILEDITVPSNNEGFYFDEFKKLVKRHSSEFDNELQEIIDRRFINQIKNKKNNVSE